MPVLIEMTCLVARAERLRRAPGAAGDAAGLGARYLLDDGEVVAMSFDRGDALRRARWLLEGAGLSTMRDGEPADVAVVDQVRGPGLWWPWLELAVVPGPGGRLVLAARHAGSQAREVAVPPGWRFDGSPSGLHGVGAVETADRPLRHERREAACDLYVDRWTGEEVRLLRASPRVRVTLEGPGGLLGEVTAEVASRWKEIEVGLMFREALGPDEGMLFRFESPRLHGFWMKNTRVPLDILFIGPAGTVVNVAEQARPLRLREHRSDGPVREVLEVPGGWCRAHGVGAGARMRVVWP